MKANWIIISVFTLLIINTNRGETSTIKAYTSITEDISLYEIQDFQELARQNGCFECHGMVKDKVINGPSFSDISEKYKSDTLSLVKTNLVNAVSQGSKGNWTELSKGVPMPPYSGRLTDIEIDRLVDWILSL